jgi:hypothetical protein
MLFLDSGVGFFNLLTLALVNEHSKTDSKKYLYTGGVTAGLSALSKLFGLASIIFLLAYGLTRYRKQILRSKPMVISILLSILIALTWPVYALSQAGSLFIQIQLANGSRSAFSFRNFSIPIFQSNYEYTTVFLGSGVIFALVLGWLALLYSVRSGRLRLVQLCFYSYVSVVAVLHYLGFYTVIPALPFLAIGIGQLVMEIFGRTRKTVTYLFERRRLMAVLSGSDGILNSPDALQIYQNLVNSKISA